MKIISNTKRFAINRKGLAPLEMVLCAPLLMFIMALMMMIGNAGAWKVRSLATSREAIWTTLGAYNGSDNEHPIGWPQDAPLLIQDATPSIFDTDLFSTHTVVRGPALTADLVSGGTASLSVITPTLDIRDGITKGHTHLRRPYPVFSSQYTRGINFPRDHLIFGGSRWSIRDMGIWNDSRRILSTYELELESYDPGAFSEFQNASLRTTAVYNEPGLFPLDRDSELAAWFGGFHSWAIDFHPTPCGQCENCPQTTQELSLVVQNLADRIHGKNGPAGAAETMATRFRQMYQEQLDLLNAQDPPPTGGNVTQLEELIEQLTNFINSLQ